MKRWVDSSAIQFVKLNAFQKVMRLWDQIHPYNAAQAFRLEGPPDVQRIEDAWRVTLNAMGLGRTIVQDDNLCHTTISERDDRWRLQNPAAGTRLDEFLSREMNVRIDPDDCCPFRAFVLQEDGTHCLGVTYHHWVADSASIRRLLHEWYLRLYHPARAGPRSVRIPTVGMWELFGPQQSGWRVDDAILSLLRYRTRFCRARRIDRPMGDCSVKVSLTDVPEGVGAMVLSLAKKHRATVNDVFLAVLAQVIDRQGANSRTRDRDELAVGTVVDLRAMSGRKMDDLFGLFLGFTTTMLRPADLRDWPRLVRTVARQNAFHKRSKTPQMSVLRMAVGLAEAKFMAPRRWAELYRQRMPVAAGISNVNMTRDWAGLYHPSPILDYFRVSPTGPMVPLLFTPTTIGDRLNFLITAQRSLIDDNRHQQIAQAIRNRLIELAGNARL